MRRNAGRKPEAPVMAGFVFCLLVATVLIGCQSTSADKALMPGIVAVEQVSLQEDFTWKPELECAPCQSLEAKTAAASACTDFSDAPSNCVNCHDDAPELTTVHTGIRNAKPTAELMHTAVENDACTGCHDKADLADRTRDSIALVDSNQTTMNPHALPENKGHSKIGCTDCHSAHESTDVLERAPQACQNCHHADIYDCETCH